MEPDEQPLNGLEDSASPQAHEAPDFSDYDPNAEYQFTGADEPEEEQDDAPAPVAEAAPVPEATYTPSAPTLSVAGLTAEDRERLNEMLATDPIAAIDEYFNYRQQQLEQARVAQDWHLTQIQEVAPEYVRVHGPTMQRAMSQLPPQNRATREGAHTAIAWTILEEMNATNDVVGTLQRHASLVGGKRPATQSAPAAPRQAAPPSQRVPAPSVGAPMAAPSGRQRVEPDVKMIMDTFGLSETEARMAVAGVRETSAGNTRRYR